MRGGGGANNSEICGNLHEGPGEMIWRLTGAELGSSITHSIQGPERDVVESKGKHDEE